MRNPDRARSGTADSNTGPLSPEALLAAISGHLDSAEPLVEWARELAYLHMTSTATNQTGASSHAEIARIITAIDSLMLPAISRDPAGHKNTHTPGQVCSAVAEHYAKARWALESPDDATLTEAWRRLGEALESYAQLVFGA
ncbi:hypothetical protein [Nocardia sp. NPDC051832]|uniref:hypothetical protein n=1 Tax=Nocardia sp. NPDC051832 TaxID=3155673 RepID=UPI00343CF8CF